MVMVDRLDEARGRGMAAFAAAGGELDQAPDLEHDVVLHRLAVGGRDREIAIGGVDAVAAQMLAQQEGVERGQGVDDAQHGEVAFHRARIVVADAAQVLVIAALVDEEGTAAGLQVLDVERHDDLGRDRAAVGKHVSLVRAHAVLEQDAAVHDRRGEERRAAVIGIVAIGDGDGGQVQDAAGRGAGERRQGTYGTIICQKRNCPPGNGTHHGVSG